LPFLLIYILQIAEKIIIKITALLKNNNIYHCPMSGIHIKKYFLCLFLILVFIDTLAQTGNHVFTGAQMTNFGTISLSTPASKTWSTDRLATPGYFSATNVATYSNASDLNNINGYVKKYGNQAFTFPVGNGTDLRTLTIGAPTSVTDAYATAWILGNPSGNLDPTGPNGGPHNVLSVTFPVRAVSIVGQWDWQAGVDMGNTGDGVSLSITASIPDMTSFANTPSLRLVGWNGSSWIDLSGSATATGNTENSSLSGYMQAGISAIGIGSTWYVLPVKLLSFTAREKACGASLNWTTTNEENMERYEIEQSNNGNTYVKSGVVNARGTNNETKYAFTTSQSATDAYYRLKMVDKDGSYSYSQVEHVKINCKTSNNNVTVYPNPVTDGYLFLNFSTESTGAAKIMLNNALGQQLKTLDIKVNAGNNIIKFESGRLPKGIYFIQIISTGNKSIFQAQKIIVE
jgi:hypothetical protein